MGEDRLGGDVIRCGAFAGKHSHSACLHLLGSTPHSACQHLSGSTPRVLLPIAYCSLSIAYCPLPFACCMLPLTWCLMPTAYCHLYYCIYCILPSVQCLLLRQFFSETLSSMATSSSPRKALRFPSPWPFTTTATKARHTLISMANIKCSTRSSQSLRGRGHAPPSSPLARTLHWKSWLRSRARGSFKRLPSQRTFCPRLNVSELPHQANHLQVQLRKLPPQAHHRLVLFQTVSATVISCTYVPSRPSLCSMRVGSIPVTTIMTVYIRQLITYTQMPFSWIAL